MHATFALSHPQLGNTHASSGITDMPSTTVSVLVPNMPAEMDMIPMHATSAQKGLGIVDLALLLGFQIS